MHEHIAIQDRELIAQLERLKPLKHGRKEMERVLSHGRYEATGCGQLQHALVLLQLTGHEIRLAQQRINALPVGLGQEERLVGHDEIHDIEHLRLIDTYLHTL